MKYDYLVVGAGLFGAVFAREAADAGKKVLVIDRRGHIGGNVYTKETEGIQVHQYGAHIFHTNYFNALYQGIPTGGYTAMMARLLQGIEVQLNEDYLENRAHWDALAKKVVYTGPIDRYYDYCYGNLEYRSVRFETEVLDTDNFQGNAVVNYTDPDTPYTRIIEHKHFEFGTQPKTVISREYSQEWHPGSEPYYPVNDGKNSALYAKYSIMAQQEAGTIFGGRLAEYRYYDMDAVIASALDAAKKELR